MQRMTASQSGGVIRICGIFMVMFCLDEVGSFVSCLGH